MNAEQWQEKMHEALDSGGHAEDAPRLVAHLAKHSADQAECRRFDRIEDELRSRRAKIGQATGEDIARVMGAVRRRELSVWTGRLVMAAAAAALLAAVVLPLLELGGNERTGGGDSFVSRFVGYVDPRAEDPSAEAEFVLAVVQDTSADANCPVAFGQIVVQSNGAQSAEFFKDGRRVDPEVLADEVVRGRLKLSDPDGLFDAVARKSN